MSCIIECDGECAGVGRKVTGNKAQVCRTEHHKQE